jgi:hypothetical protein
MHKDFTENLRCEKRTYRIDPSNIAFLKFVLEAYEGMAQLTTSDPALGLIDVYIAPGCANDFELLLSDLKKQMLIEDPRVPGI